MLKKIKTIALSLAGLALVACSAGPTTESTGEFIDSSATTAKIKAQLIDRLGGGALSIQVKTYKDEVQLSGFVGSQSVKSRAGEIARRNPGVRVVRNDLVVK
ncbi:BON domain-containing protein [Legionella sp. CNM-4043-24]|uniref:BON domain-containing protein n=1 Tax=Legionella sp. CNM-4043-24 TaxID=3421646 RepID=UPI00403AF5B6